MKCIRSDIKYQALSEEVSTLSKSDTDEGSVFRRNGGTDTGNVPCHSTEVHSLTYFAYWKEMDQRFLKCSMNTGEPQVSVINP